MPLFESLKSLFWQLPLLSDSEEQEIFYYLKGKIKGEAKGVHSDDVLGRYIKELLATQDLSNSFSIDYPKKPLIKLQKDDPKLIAYYLPQYYPDPHNERDKELFEERWDDLKRLQTNIEYATYYENLLTAISPSQLDF